MKITFTLFVAVAAGNGRGLGGKHGNTDVTALRYNWKEPKCITSPELCNDNVILTQLSGNITFDNEMYTNYKTVMYQIRLGANRRISLQFDKDFGFGMEYHNMCGYDKLHLFTGTADNFDQSNRIARFCGPKSHNGKRPYDGSGKIKPKWGMLPIWNTPFNTYSGDIIVAVDIDQERDDFHGFRLMWNSEPVNTPDFSKFKDAVGFAKSAIIQSLLAMNMNKVSNVIGSVNKYFAGVDQRANQTNKCNKKWHNAPSTSMQSKFELAFEMTSGYKQVEFIMQTMTDLMFEYVGNCKAAHSWETKRATQMKKITKNMI